MRVPRRLVLEPYSYFHMMWRAHNRERIMSSHAEKLRYLRALRDDYLKNCSPEQFELHGYTMMSNHGHINGSVKEDHVPLSDHMRRAHSRFGLEYNKRHGRIGKVAHDRPKIKASRQDADAIRIMLYDHFNPVRAGLTKDPTDIRWKQLSTARWMAYGEENEFTCVFTLPPWYRKLGSTAKKRQRAYRKMLDEWALEKGYKRDPKLARGNFVGGDLWVAAMRRKVSQWFKERKKKNPSEAGPDPPVEAQGG